jgi:hypothetical protein
MRTGGEVLGMPVRPARALVLSEENLALWHMRQQRLALGENVQLICRPFAGKCRRQNSHERWENSIRNPGGKVPSGCYARGDATWHQLVLSPTCAL